MGFGFGVWGLGSLPRVPSTGFGVWFGSLSIPPGLGVEGFARGMAKDDLATLPQRLPVGFGVGG